MTHTAWLPPLLVSVGVAGLLARAWRGLANFCPKCGTRLGNRLARLAKYCPFCGTELPKGGYCKECDRTYNFGKYCPLHGKELKAQKA